MKTLVSVFVLTVLFVFQAQAKTVVISDVDDTIKLGFTFGIARGFAYMNDTSERFTGMNQVFQLIQRDQPEAKFYYLSLAYERMMKAVHKEFLKNAELPAGTYIGRTDLSYDEHKLTKIREILAKENPERVLLVGDDGQIDAQVYRQIANDPKYAHIHFDQFIHVVSSKMDDNGKKKHQDPQVGYVTSIEFAIELQQRGYLEEKSLQYMTSQILPRILAEGTFREARGESQTFPFFINCVNIDWKWNIPGLNERIKQVCK